MRKNERNRIKFLKRNKNQAQLRRFQSGALKWTEKLSANDHCVSLLMNDCKKKCFFVMIVADSRVYRVISVALHNFFSLSFSLYLSAVCVCAVFFL